MNDQKNTPKPVAITSPDLQAERIAQLKHLMPDLFDGDGQLDQNALQDLVSDDVATTAERFRFEWAGKQQSKRLAFTPSKATLTYDPTRSLNKDGSENKADDPLTNNTSNNLIIEGDNLEVLKLLQATYFEQVKCIYIDPPYNTGKDFIYPDNFTEGKKAYWEKNGTVKEGVKLTALPETHGRRHSAWLNFMQSRLLLARQMLRDDGVIFVSIDDNEVHNLRKLMDEIFGTENFIECITWNKRIPKNDKGIGNIHEYILLYVKDSALKPEFKMRKDGLDEIYELLEKLKRKKIDLSSAENEIKKLYKKNDYDRGITLYNSLDERYRLWGKINMSWPNANTFGPDYKVLHPKTKKPVKMPDRGWRWKEETFNDAAGIVNGQYSNIIELHDDSFMCGKIWFAKDENTQPSSITYLDAVNTFLLRSILSTKSDGGVEVENLFEGKSYFSYPKPTSLMQTLFSSNPAENGDIYLDFFAGSATVAHAIMDLNAEDGGNRKHIMVQIPEITDEKSEAYKAGYKTISDITIERVKRAGAKIRAENPEVDIDTGFRVFKLSPSKFPENLFAPDPDKSEEENKQALKQHIELSQQKYLFEKEYFNDFVTEIALKNGFGLFYDLEKVNDINRNDVYRISGNNKTAWFCLDDRLHGETVEALKKYSEDVLIVTKHALNTTAKFNLCNIFGDTLRIL